jgi:hypothetical protein
MSDLSTMGTHRNRWVYWVAIGLLAALVVIGLATFRGARETQAANDKADEFLAVLAEAGVDPLPSREQVVGVLGEDGGATCADPADALAQATLHSQLTNGATGPGQRPVVVDSRLVRGQLAVMSVYCPDQLEAVRAYLDDLETDDVVRG